MNKEEDAIPTHPTIHITIDQPGLHLEIQGKPHLTPLHQSLLKAYTFHTCYTPKQKIDWTKEYNKTIAPQRQEDTSLNITLTDTPEENNTLEQIRQTIPDTDNLEHMEQLDIIPFSEEDVVCPSNTEGINNNAGLLQSLINVLIHELPNDFTVGNIADIVLRFYYHYHHKITDKTALNYAHAYKRYLLREKQIQQISDERNITPRFTKTIEGPIEPPTKQDITDTCIDSIGQILLNNPPGQCTKKFFIKHLQTFTEEEIDKTITHLIACGTLIQIGKDHYEFNPVSHVIENNMGENR